MATTQRQNRMDAPTLAKIATCSKCKKMSAPGRQLCPRCELEADYAAGASHRRALKAALTREANKAKEAALACSPLKAINTEFGKPVRHLVNGFEPFARVRDAGRRR